MRTPLLPLMLMAWPPQGPISELTIVICCEFLITRQSPGDVSFRLRITVPFSPSITILSEAITFVDVLTFTAKDASAATTANKMRILSDESHATILLLGCLDGSTYSLITSRPNQERSARPFGGGLRNAC